MPSRLLYQRVGLGDLTTHKRNMRRRRPRCATASRRTCSALATCWFPSLTGPYAVRTAVKWQRETLSRFTDDCGRITCHAQRPGDSPNRCSVRLVHRPTRANYRS